MFEISQYNRRFHTARTDHPHQSYSYDRDIMAVSLLYWSEHCTECAAPACYKTCDLYQARPDGRCRRFLFGIHRNHAFPSIRGYGSEVAFKKWGVLVARGNTQMIGLPRALWIERLLNGFALFLNTTGTLAYYATSDVRWKHLNLSFMLRLTAKLATYASESRLPDSFLLQIYNPGSTAVRLQFTIETAPSQNDDLVTVGQTRPRFSTTVTLPPGFSSNEFDTFLFKALVKSGLPFDVSLAPEADSEARLVFLTADFVIRKRARTDPGRTRQVKCLVLDLDNTLWDGTLLEDPEVTPKEYIRDLLATLDSRGILLSLASKNDFDAAWSRLSAFGLQDYFLVPQIGWQPKSQSLKVIAEKLNINLDSLAFVDDSAFERQEVGMALPQVACFDAKDLPSLVGDPRLQGSNTSEARNRRQYYVQTVARDEKRAEFGQDYEKFLAYCEIMVRIVRYHVRYSERVEELVQRTNQLNFSGVKYTRQQLGEILTDTSLEKYILHCSDRFGDYGTVGFAVVTTQQDIPEVSDFMLSCRVQGKLVEAAFFEHLARYHSMSNTASIRIRFCQTDRNTPARRVLHALGVAEAGNDGTMTVTFDDHRSVLNIVHIECGCDAFEGNSNSGSPGPPNVMATRKYD